MLDDKTQIEREREAILAQSAAPLLGGLCRLLASGGRCGIDPRLFTLGEPSHLPQRCLRPHTCCHVASGNSGLGAYEPYPRRASSKFYLLGGDLASARASSTTLYRGRGRRSPPTAFLPSLPRRSQSASQLGGGVPGLSDCDSGKEGEIGNSTMAEEMGAAPPKVCKLCRYAEGICASGFRKHHERTDPQCRLHGSVSQGTTPPTRGQRQPRPKSAPRVPALGEEEETHPELLGGVKAKTTLDDMTQFRTRKGLHITRTLGQMDRARCEPNSCGGVPRPRHGGAPRPAAEKRI